MRDADLDRQAKEIAHKYLEFAQELTEPTRLTFSVGRKAYAVSTSLKHIDNDHYEVSASLRQGRRAVAYFRISGLPENPAVREIGMAVP